MLEGMRQLFCELHKADSHLASLKLMLCLIVPICVSGPSEIAGDKDMFLNICAQLA